MALTNGQYFGILLGAQAAGIGANLYAERQKQKMLNAGTAVEKAQNRLRQQEEQLAATEATNASLEQLREILATQRAIAGARGQAVGQGSALATANKAMTAQAADERAIKLSNTFKQSQLQSMSRLLDIKKAGHRTEFGSSLIETGMKNFNLNQTIGNMIDKYTNQRFGQYLLEKR